MIADMRPAQARTTYVRTAFSLPSGVVVGAAGAPEHVFYSARVLAFVSGIASVRRALTVSQYTENQNIHTVLLR